MKDNALFDLVHRLGKAEKRYFKLYASRAQEDGNKFYTCLFDALLVFKTYDEKLLLTILKKDFANLTPRLLQAHKSHLHDLLLDALRLFHSNRTKALSIYRLLENIEILYEKGLNRQAQKELNAAYKMAEQAHYTTLLPELNRWAMILQNNLSDSELSDRYKAHLSQLSTLQQETILQECYTTAIALRTKASSTRNEQSIQDFDAFMQHDLLRNYSTEPPHLSFWVRLRQLQIWAMYYFVKQNFEAELETNRVLVAHLDANPLFLQEQPSVYIGAYSRWLILLKRKNIPLYLVQLTVFETFPQQLQRDKARAEAKIFFLVSGMEILRLMQNNDFQALYAQFPVFFAKHEQYQKFAVAEQEVGFWYKCAYICMALSHSEEALIYLNKIINEFEEKARADIYAYALILRVLVHYSLKNWDLLPYIAQTTFAHLEKRRQFSQSERFILKFIKKASKQLSEAERTAHLLQLQQKLLQVVHLPTERFILNYFDFPTWLKAQIEHKSFLEAKN
jgi:hypothetical protein